MGLSYYIVEKMRAAEIWKPELALISGCTSLEANVLSKLGSAHNVGKTQEALTISISDQVGEREATCGRGRKPHRHWQSLPLDR